MSDSFSISFVLLILQTVKEIHIVSLYLFLFTWMIAARNIADAYKACSII